MLLVILTKGKIVFMTDLDFWLELDPATDPIKVTVSQNTPVHRLKDIILARLELLKGKIPDASSYQFICLRNGSIIGDNEDPVSLFFRENDRFMVKSVPIASPNQAGDTLITKGEFKNAPINDLEANSAVVT